MVAVATITANIKLKNSILPMMDFDLHQPHQRGPVTRLQPSCWKEDELRLSRMCLLLAAIVVGPAALAADADNGKRLAELRCVPCHAVAQTPRRVVADAPPFEIIARKFASQPEMLAFAILDPHPRMSVAVTRRDVEDIAAYINTLAK
jgi:mono/diheme cytochrome c family protein